MLVEKDKQLHFIAGLLIYIIFHFLFNPAIAFIFVVIIGATKEGIDYCGYGTPEIADFLYTLIGGIAAYLFVSLL